MATSTVESPILDSVNWGLHNYLDHRSQLNSHRMLLGAEWAFLKTHLLQHWRCSIVRFISWMMITHRASLLDRCTRLSSDSHVEWLVNTTQSEWCPRRYGRSPHQTEGLIFWNAILFLMRHFSSPPSLPLPFPLFLCLLVLLLLFFPPLVFFPSPLFQHLCSLCAVIVFSIDLVSLLFPLHDCPQPPPSPPPPHYHLNIIVLLFSSLIFWKRRKKRKRIREGKCEIPNHYLPPLPPFCNFFRIFVLSY